MDKLRLDSHKLMYQPLRVAQLMAADTWEKAKSVYPLYVEVSPMGACNHRCSFCAVDYLGYQSHRIDAGFIGETLYKMYVCGTKSVMFAGEGEPLLHKDINGMVRTARDIGLDVAITTNGVLLNKLDPIDEISWIRVSMNAGTRETYAKIHRTDPRDFDRVLANLADAVLRKGKCSISAQMVLLPENAHEVETLKQIGKDIGLDFVAIKPYSQHRSSLNKQDGVVAAPEDSVGLVVRRTAFETSVMEYDKCRATPNLWAYIRANGDVYSCSAFLGDDRFNLGNINRQTFREIWQGDKRRENWEMMQAFDVAECRMNCRMNQCNIYLHDIVEGTPFANFI